MGRLVRAFAIGTYQIVGNLMSRLIYHLNNNQFTPIEMDFTIIINWMSLFPILGFLDDVSITIKWFCTEDFGTYCIFFNSLFKQVYTAT